jgi:hypothetical protein
MTVAGSFCGMPAGHLERCRTPEAVARGYARATARRQKLIAERHKWVDQYKLSRGCIDCGFADHPVALDFDHRDPELKIADVSSLLWAPLARLQAELNKCDVRCANCHRIITYNRRRPVPSIAEDGPVAR